MASRLAWHQLSCGVPPLDGVVAWRRDAVLELQGFSMDAADPELELVVRLQTVETDRAAGRVVRTSEVFGQTPPLTIARAASRSAVRQRAVVEALRALAASPRSVHARLRMMSVLSVELFTPAAQVMAMMLILAGTAAGWFGWRTPFYAVVMLAFGYGVVSASALLLRGGAAGAPVGAGLRRLLLRAPLEFLVYRPALAWARIGKS
jgi:hypothetical protein